MAFKHYDVVRAASPSDLADTLAQKIREGWQLRITVKEIGE
nr:DUF1737 domain-containing protein [Escherichia coli]